MDYRYKDTIAVPREYAITRNWLYKVKDQTIFVLGQEFHYVYTILDSLSCWHENTPALYEQCSHSATKSEIQKPIRYVTIHS